MRWHVPRLLLREGTAQQDKRPKTNKRDAFAYSGNIQINKRRSDLLGTFWTDLEFFFFFCFWQIQQPPPDEGITSPCPPSCDTFCGPDCPVHCCNFPFSNYAQSPPPPPVYCPQICRNVCSSFCPEGCCTTTKRGGIRALSSYTITISCPSNCDTISCNVKCPRQCCQVAPGKSKAHLDDLRPPSPSMVRVRSKMTCPPICFHLCSQRCPDHCCVEQSERIGKPQHQKIAIKGRIQC